tara:strand:- start:1893 stop:2294 length:402 start_codon:yes stop_codon:yes gene_type:complete
MNLKKNSFKLFSIFYILFISSCSSNIGQIEGSSKFSSIIDNKSYHYHIVEVGDNLWDISQSYYNNHLLWPIIFKNNQNIIYDADLILPGQSIIIDKNISRETKANAQAYAKIRGLWVLGYREESDIEFLENNK